VGGLLKSVKKCAIAVSSNGKKGLDCMPFFIFYLFFFLFFFFGGLSASLLYHGRNYTLKEIPREFGTSQ